MDVRKEGADLLHTDITSIQKYILRTTSNEAGNKSCLQSQI